MADKVKKTIKKDNENTPLERALSKDATSLILNEAPWGESYEEEFIRHTGPRASPSPQRQQPQQPQQSQQPQQPHVREEEWEQNQASMDDLRDKGYNRRTSEEDEELRERWYQSAGYRKRKLMKSKKYKKSKKSKKSKRYKKITRRR